MHAAQANAETAKVPVIDLTADIDAERRPSRVHVGLLVAAGLVAVGTAALTLGSLTTSSSNVSTAPSSNPVPATNRTISNPSGTSPSTDISSIASSSQTVDVTSQTSQASQNELPAQLYNQVATSLPRIQAAAPATMREGSGMFVTDDGHIATSAELVVGSDYVLAWTDDGQRWKANIVAIDRISDVAVVQIDSEAWPALPLSDQVDLATGQTALALDYENQQISLGEITSLGPMVGLDQPAALPGSAIFDDRGNVIAMTVSTQPGVRKAAVPAWMLEQVAVDLISSGETTHTWLGLLVEPNADFDDMVMVNEVVADSPADVAGLRVGDLVDSFNGVDTPDWATLYRQVQNASPGDEVVLTVTRNGSRRIIIATLAELG